MNLQENIDRIHQMMGIINENKVADIIQEMGLYNAIRYFGGYDNLEKKMGDYVLSNDEMICVMCLMRLVSRQHLI
jgi:hypothetical protein